MGGALIISNSIFMGVEIDYTARNPIADTPSAYVGIGYVYAAAFTLELVMRLGLDRLEFFCAKTMNAIMWNYLDLFIVLSSLAEVALDIVKYAQEASAEGDDEQDEGISMSNLRIIRIIRVTRLLRLLRIGRIVRFISALRLLVYSIVHTLKSVFWSMLLLTIIIYVFGILFTQAATDYRVQLTVAGKEPLLTEEADEALQYHWGTLSASMMSLYMAISGGVSWLDIYRTQSVVNPMGSVTFLIYITFTYFAVLNVIVGIFCQSAIESQQADQEAMVHAFLANQHMFTKRFKVLFQTVDSDNSGYITKEEFMAVVDEPKVRAYFATLDLHAEDAITLFRMLDESRDEEEGIDVEDFVNGCLRLKGPAKSYDCARLMSEVKCLARELHRQRKLADISYRILSGGRPPPPLDGSTMGKRQAASRTTKASQIRETEMRPTEVRRTEVRSSDKEKSMDSATANDFVYNANLKFLPK